MSKKEILLPILLIVLAVVSRIVNVEYSIWLNLSVIGAISLFGGAVIKNKALAYLLPFVAYLLSDVYIELFTDLQGFYGMSQLFTYGAMLLVVSLGSTMKNIKPLNVLGYSLGSSAIFWIVSNFGVWFGNLFTNFEPGLTLGFTYLRALPFYNAIANELFLGSFVGDLFYSIVLFGAYALLSVSKQDRAVA